MTRWQNSVRLSTLVEPWKGPTANPRMDAMTNSGLTAAIEHISRTLKIPCKADKLVETMALLEHFQGIPAVGRLASRLKTAPRLQANLLDLPDDASGEIGHAE